MKNSFDKLTDSLKAKLSDAKEFVKATVKELMDIPQDLLSSLQVWCGSHGGYVITCLTSPRILIRFCETARSQLPS